MRLRSDSVSRDVNGRVHLGHGDGNLGRVKIPDLNLLDESNPFPSEGGVDELNIIEDISNGSASEKEAVAGVEGEGMGVEDGETVEGLKSSDTGSLQVSLSKADGFSGGFHPLGNVGLEAKEIGRGMLDCVLGSGSSLAAVVKNLGNAEEKIVFPDEEGELKEKSVEPNVGAGEEGFCQPKLLTVGKAVDGDSYSPVCVNGNYRDENQEEILDCDPYNSKIQQSHIGAVKGFSEKISAREGSRGKFGGSLEEDAKGGRIQVVGKVLRSRVVPGIRWTDEAAGISFSASPSRRKRVNDGREDTAVTLKSDTKKLVIDSVVRCNSERPKSPTDLPDREVVKLNKTPRVSKADDGYANADSVRSSVVNRKRGRPKKSMDPSAERTSHTSEVVKLNKTPRVSKTDNGYANANSFGSSVVDRKRGRPKKSMDPSVEWTSQMNGVQAVSEGEDQVMNCRSSPSLRKTDLGKRETFDCPKEDHEVSKVENEAGDASRKSVGSSTQTRRSKRLKRVVDYCENDAIQRKKMSSIKVDDDPENGNEVLGSTVGSSSKKRGRPKNERGDDTEKMISQDQDQDCKIKVLVVSASDAGPSLKEVSSVTKRTSGRPGHTVGTSEVEDPSLTEKGLSVEQNGDEAPRSLATEKNAIRNQIVDMLLRAGWTIQHRPRAGREYMDAVYVNPDGNTHWSVTKAYKSLQRKFEEGKVHDFTPLPEEVLSKLFRVVSKIRSDKNKKKKHKGDGESSDEEDTRDEDGNKVGAKRKHSALKRKSLVKGGSQSKRRCALVARRSKGLNSESNDATAHSGKHSVLAWMIDSGALSLGGKVHYRNCQKTKTILEGSVTRDGIQCQCCKEVISVSEFEKHAGSKLFRPFENLYLENGQSLLQCLLDSWNKQESAGRMGYHSVNVDVEDPNDDTCAICGDGGDLMCCDGCPSTFHQDCLEMEEVPSGEWHCVYCSCKFCGTVGDATDDCDIASSWVTCLLCEKKYHKSCTDEEDAVHFKSGRQTFCDKNCRQIYDQLQRLTGVKGDLEDGYSWTLLQRSDVDVEAVSLEAQKIQNNSKLAVALAVMDECFVPIIDPRSGINLIRHVVYNCGSNFNRLNFSSFFTFVLEKGDEVICAASVRIHGKQLAEMPFIGTRNAYRRQGMCLRLLTAIELALGSLDIQHLVIPAIPDLVNTWTSVFGFQPIEDAVKEDMGTMNLLVFAHTDMLQKPLGVERENDANFLKSSDEPFSCGVDKSEVDDSCVNGPFDLNVASSIADSSSDEKHDNFISDNCGVIVKSRNSYGDMDDSSEVHTQPSMKNSGTQVESSVGVPNSYEGRVLRSDLNLVEGSMGGSSVDPDYLEPPSDIKCHVHPSAIVNAEEAAESTRNSGVIPKLDSSSPVENGPDGVGNSTSVENAFSVRILNPDLNLSGDDVSQVNLCAHSNLVDNVKGGNYSLPGKSDLCKKETISLGEHGQCEFVCSSAIRGISETSCYKSSAAGKSNATGLFDGNGVPKVGSN